MAVTGIKIIGDIAKFNQFLRPTRVAILVDEEIKKATIDNALFLIDKVKGLIRAAKLRQNSPLTLALSQGELTLLKEKNLFDALGIVIKSSLEAEVGLIEGKRSTGGVKSSPIPIEQVVINLHKGFTIDVTDEMRAAIAIALRKKGKGDPLSASRGKGKSTYRVKPIPFLTKVFENKRNQDRIRTRWIRALEQAFRKAGVEGPKFR